MRLFALPISDVETGRMPRFPDLQPLHVSVPPEKAFSAVSAVAGVMKSWTVVKVDTSARLLTAEARSRLWGFVDDVTVRVEAEGDNGAVVHMRIRSRTGSFDRKAGPRRIRRFLERVAEEIGPGAKA